MTTKKATKKPTTKKAERKTGLRKPQIRILAALKKAGKELTRAQIAEKAPVDNAFCTEYLGAADPERRAKNDLKFPSLLTLKLITAKHSEADGKALAVYSITAAGVKALESAKSK